MIADILDTERVGRDMFVRGNGLIVCHNCRHPGRVGGGVLSRE